MCFNRPTRRTMRTKNRFIRERAGRRAERSATSIRRRGITGVFACRTAKRCSSSISGLERSARSPGWISAISSSGEKTMCRPINWRSWRMTRRCRLREVVRGADLLLSTFRQLLIYRALGLSAPQFYHTELITDASGQRLAKRHAALSLRELRKAGADPEELRRRYRCEPRREVPNSGAAIPGTRNAKSRVR